MSRYRSINKVNSGETMVLFKVPGSLGINVPGPRGIGDRDLLGRGRGRNVNAQAPSTGWNGDLHPPSYFSVSPRLPMANKRAIVNSSIDEAEEDSSNICYNVKGEAFGKLMMGLRDEAVTYAQSRRAELLRWDDRAKARTMKWFNTAEQEIRDYLLPRIDSVIRVLRGLTPDSFEYDTAENNVEAGCLPGQGLGEEGVVASVCAADIARHKILINMRFFEIPKRGVIYGTNKFNGKDSQLLALIHEVTHFNDVAGSKDPYYGSSSALANAKQPKARMNADSLASYILGMDITVPYQVE